MRRIYEKNIRMIGGIVLLVILLAGAALVGGRLLNGQRLTGGPGMFQGGGKGSGDQDIMIDLSNIQPDSELPQTPTDLSGVFVRRQDNSIFAGTGDTLASGFRRDEQGTQQPFAEYNGQVVEIVVTSRTMIYEDVTMRQYNGQPPEEQQIQQVVEPGSLGRLYAGCTLSVWGNKTGDRYIADVLVYQCLAPPG